MVPRVPGRSQQPQSSAVLSRQDKFAKKRRQLDLEMKLGFDPGNCVLFFIACQGVVKKCPFYLIEMT